MGDKPHHYRFRLLALDVGKLPAEPGNVQAIHARSGRHVLGHAELVGTYRRP